MIIIIYNHSVKFVNGLFFTQSDIKNQQITLWPTAQRAHSLGNFPSCNNRLKSTDALLVHILYGSSLSTFPQITCSVVPTLSSKTRGVSFENKKQGTILPFLLIHLGRETTASWLKLCAKMT